MVENSLYAAELTLTLFVLRVLLVDHVELTFPADYLAIGATLLDRGFNFHLSIQVFS